MNWLSILIATAVIGGISLIIGILLGVAAKKFAVDEDPLVSQIAEVLPNNNCGGCGYPGCTQLAIAIAENKAQPTACPVGGEDVAKKIGELLGSDVEFVKKVAYVSCVGDCDKSSNKYEYYGEKSCELMDYVPGKGEKACKNGCLGYGSCVKVCDSDAISVKNGVAVVDNSKCTACGKCVIACPKNLINIIPENKKILVSCSSNDIGKNVIKACETGCIGCKKCERTCPKKAIAVKNNIPVIDDSLCVGCGICVKDCPRGVLIKNI